MPTSRASKYRFLADQKKFEIVEVQVDDEESSDTSSSNCSSQEEIHYITSSSDADDNEVVSIRSDTQRRQSFEGAQGLSKKFFWLKDNNNFNV